MRQAGEWESERVIAWLCVLGAHLLFWWLLMRASSVAVPFTARDDDEALRMVWIDPPMPLPRTQSRLPDSHAGAGSVAPATRAPRPARSMPPPREAPESVATAPIAAEAATAQAAIAPTMTATFIEQGRHLLQAHEDFAPDPLADRGVNLPGNGGAGRFRMRKPRSVRGVVNKIGMLFGGGEFDPCPGIRQSIADLAADGDSAALQVELDARRRAACP